MSLYDAILARLTRRLHAHEHDKREPRIVARARPCKSVRRDMESQKASYRAIRRAVNTIAFDFQNAEARGDKHIQTVDRDTWLHGDISRGTTSYTPHMMGNIRVSTRECY